MNIEVTGADARAAAAARTLAVLETRRSVPASRLTLPGPTANEIEAMLTAAARVPDHGALAPWRFIVVRNGAGSDLAQRLSAACLAASDGTDAGQKGAARTVEKLHLLFGSPPLVIVVVSRPDLGATIPEREQLLSAGAVCMNLMTAAAALGYGSNWLTGWPGTHAAARPVLGLAEGETVAGIIPIGTSTEAVPDRPRPALASICTDWRA